MTYEKIERVSAIVNNFLRDMAEEEVTNFELAEAISSMILSLCEGNMKHEDALLELICDMVKSMCLINPKMYEGEK